MMTQKFLDAILSFSMLNECSLETVSRKVQVCSYKNLVPFLWV